MLLIIVLISFIYFIKLCKTIIYFIKQIVNIQNKTFSNFIKQRDKIMYLKDIKPILQNLKKDKKITLESIGKAIGVKKSTISNRIKGNSKVQIYELKKIESFFDVDLSNYIDKENVKSGLDFYMNKAAREEESDFIELRVKGEVYASMGFGVTVYDETQTGTYKISKELARDLNISSHTSEVIFASGDSMYPTIEGGDSLIVDTSKTEIYDGKIYCVRIDGQLYAKRLQLIPPKKIKVISDNNEKYDAFYVDLAKQIDYDFAVIGEVRYWGRIAK